MGGSFHGAQSESGSLGYGLYRNAAHEEEARGSGVMREGIMKTLAVVFLLGTLTFAQSAPKPMVPMPGSGHKKLMIGLIAAGAGAVVAGVVAGSGSSTRKPIPVKGGPVFPK